MIDFYTTWRKELTEEFEKNSETWNSVISCTLTEDQLDKKFDDGYGGTNGDPFTVWTACNVYFPGCYDGAEWATSVPRNPNGIPTEHIGGG